MTTLGGSTPDTTGFPRLIPGRFYDLHFDGEPAPDDSEGGPTFNWIFSEFVGEWWGFDRRDGNARIVINPATVRYVEVYRDETGDIDNFGTWG